MVKINQERLAIKGHYFFFFGAMGPFLPFFPLIGKQLGMNEFALGTLSSVFPIVYLIIKPLFGYFADYFHQWRKIIFITLVILTCITFDLLFLVQDSVVHYNCGEFPLCSNSTFHTEKCELMCGNNSLVLLKSVDASCLLDDNSSDCIDRELKCTLNCPSAPFHLTPQFWMYVILSSLGNIWFNITNFISDAICFDVIGEGNDKKYGMQRVWGTISFGITAFLCGYLIDLFSNDSNHKSYTPAFILATAYTLFDLYFCNRLKLPPFVKAESIFKDVFTVVRKPKVSVFLVFATLVGMLDSSIIFFLLWYLEDLAKLTGKSDNIKLLQGITIAAETSGETVAFFLTERLLRGLGYTHCLTLGLASYAVRLLLISSITDPWMVLPIESVMQGPTYALLYTTVVAYASAITPPGTSATVQGLVAGMDDGLGFSLGSMLGGILYYFYGGRTLYITYGIMALVCAISHHLICAIFFKDTISQESNTTYLPACTSEVPLSEFEDGFKKIKSQN